MSLTALCCLHLPLQLPCATHLPGPQHHHQQQQQQQQGTRASAVVVSGVSKKRNPIREVGRDVLPDGAPNTPWRRLKLRIQTAVSLQVSRWWALVCASACVHGSGVRSGDESG
jgi:hypothetical protein